MHRIIILLATIISLWGCTERYRYPCQDPDNWEEKRCQKPYCSANGTCPEDLRHYEKNPQNQSPVSQPVITDKTVKGACKC